MADEQPTSGDHVPTSSGVIEIHIRELSQLFNSLDPSPFHEKELDPSAEEYIVSSAEELSPQVPAAMIVYLDKPAGLPDEARVLAETIRVHFTRRSQRLRWDLRQLIRRGWISLSIGLAFLVACVIGGQAALRLFGETAMSRVLEVSLLIGGWVAMWKPLEIFLYDWWPILGQCRLYDRLRRIPVRIIYP